MIKRDDGGPAFPCIRRETVSYHNEELATFIADVERPGMSLRDWFAGQALIGLAQLVGDPSRQGALALASKNLGIVAVRDVIPVIAYEYADAMLATRAARKDD